MHVDSAREVFLDLVESGGHGVEDEMEAEGPEDGALHVSDGVGHLSQEIVGAEKRVLSVAAVHFHGLLCMNIEEVDSSEHDSAADKSDDPEEL